MKGEEDFARASGWKRYLGSRQRNENSGDGVALAYL